MQIASFELGRYEMDSASTEALQRLSAVLTELLPDAPSAELTPSLEVFPLRISPTGLGGYVGPSHEPEGDILGRRVEASARVAVKAANAEDLGAAVAAVTRALLAADRLDLRSKGILRIELGAIGPAPAAEGGAARREVDFKVLFELLRKPAEAGGVIQEIPIEIETDSP